MQVKIYHNPRCTKSREALALLNDRNIKPEICEYLKEPINEKELANIIKLLGISPRNLLRKNEPAYKENNLESADIIDSDIIKIMIKNPSLIERPIVIVDDLKAVIGRPPENILKIIS